MVSALGIFQIQVKYIMPAGQIDTSDGHEDVYELIKYQVLSKFLTN